MMIGLKELRLHMHEEKPAFCSLLLGSDSPLYELDDEYEGIYALFRRRGR